MDSTHIGLREARAQLGDLVTAAEFGHVTTITRNGRPAAHLIPAGEGIVVLRTPDAVQAERLRRLAAEHGALGIPFPNNTGRGWRVVDEHGEPVDPHSIESVAVDTNLAGMITSINARLRQLGDAMEKAGMASRGRARPPRQRPRELPPGS